MMNDKGIRIGVTGEAQPKGLRTMVIEALEVFDSATFKGDVVFRGEGKRDGSAYCLRISRHDMNMLAFQWMQYSAEFEHLELKCSDCENPFDAKVEGTIDQGWPICGDCVHAMKH